MPSKLVEYLERKLAKNLERKVVAQIKSTTGLSKGETLGLQEYSAKTPVQFTLKRLLPLPNPLLSTKGRRRAKPSTLSTFLGILRKPQKARGISA